MHLKLKGFEGAITHSSFATTCLFGGKNLMNISRYIRGSADKWVHSRQKDFNDWRGAKIPTYNKQNSLTAKKYYWAESLLRRQRITYIFKFQRHKKCLILLKRVWWKRDFKSIVNQDAQLSKIYHLLNMYCYILSSNSCEDRDSQECYFFKWYSFKILNDFNVFGKKSSLLLFTNKRRTAMQ